VLDTAYSVPQNSLRAKEATDTRELLDWILESPGDIYALVVDQGRIPLSTGVPDPGDALEAITLRGTPLGQPGAVLLITSSSDLTIDEFPSSSQQAITRMIVVEAVGSVMNCTINQLRLSPKVLCVLDEDGTEYPDPHEDHRTIKNVVTVFRPMLITGNKVAVLKVMKTASISVQTRIASAIYFLFPHTQEELARGYEFVAGSQVPDMVAGTSTPDDTDAFEREWMLYTTLHLLGPSYEHPLELSQQLGKRMAAIAQKARCECPPAEELTTIINFLDWLRTPTGNFMPELAGHVLAYNKDRQKDLTVTESTAATFSDWYPDDHSNGWTRALFDGMLMVYQYYHSTSVSFAFIAVAQGREKLVALGEPFAQEVQAVVDLQRERGNSIYRALTADVDALQRVRTMPRMIYIGLQWLIQHAAADARDNYKRYAVSGITKHIQEQDHIMLCNHIVNILPSPSETSVGRILKNAPISVAEQVLRNHDSAFRDRVFYYLKGQPSPGAWFRDERERRERAYRTNWIKLATDRVRNAMADHVRTLREQATLIRDPEQQLRISSELNRWEMNKTRSLEEKYSLDQVLDPGKNAMDSEVRSAVIQQMAPLLQGILSTTLENFQ